MAISKSLQAIRILKSDLGVAAFDLRKYHPETYQRAVFAVDAISNTLKIGDEAASRLEGAIIRLMHFEMMKSSEEVVKANDKLRRIAAAENGVAIAKPTRKRRNLDPRQKPNGAHETDAPPLALPTNTSPSEA